MRAKNRDQSFDIMRGIGILLMVMGHVGFGEVFDKYIHAFHMPLFFFVSGYFFRTRESFQSFLLHQLKTIMVPYTVFVLLCQPLHYIYTKEWSLSYFVLSYFTSNRNRIDVAGAYWFLLCLFSAKLLFYVIVRFFSERWAVIPVLILTAASSLLRIKLPLCMDSACSMLLIMYIGYILSQHREHRLVQHIMNLQVWILVPLMMVNGYLILVSPSVNIRCNSLGSIPLFWLNMLIAVLSYCSLSKLLSQISHSVLRSLVSILVFFGRESIVALVTNEILIGITGLALGILGLRTGMILDSVIILAITLVGIFASAQILEKTKLRFCIGKF